MHYTATYSPEDNKLRLYASSRLDPETYGRVSAAGFKWAPKQEVFIAPMWTPGREDLMLDLCEEIGDEDTSLVERAEARADRFSVYSDKRARDASAAKDAAHAVMGRFELGQPILVGHHSERRARKDKERIENGLRRAVQMWETSEYWTSRAAGALRHAKYKELPAVRHRRIKGLEADKRKRERSIADAEKFVKHWLADGMTLAKATAIANYDSLSRCFPLADFPRDPPASQYEGSMTLRSALDGGVIDETQAREIALPAHQRSIAWDWRWVAHYDNRIAYERAMLNEQGGIAAERFQIEVGGRVLVGGEWLVVTRINKSGGAVVSVTTNSRYVRVKSIEEVTDYRAPDAEQAGKVKAATKLAPMVNYPGDGFAHVTQAEWNAINKDYRGTRTVDAAGTAARHRVRVALGVYVLKGEKDMNKRHGYPFVFITDAKVTQPPAPEDGVPAALPALPAPEPAGPREVFVPRAPTEFDQIRKQLRDGVKVVSAPQLFPTPPQLAARMAELAGVTDGDRVLEPSAGTGRLVEALRNTEKSMHIVAIEVNRQLAAVLHTAFGERPSDVPQEVEVIAQDFMDLQPGAGSTGQIGMFDAVVMNPPFADGQDIKHIKHALTLVKPGGRLVAICADGPKQNEQLRPLVESYGGEWERLPSGTFKESGTGVNTVLLYLQA